MRRLPPARWLDSLDRALPLTSLRDVRSWPRRTRALMNSVASWTTPLKHYMAVMAAMPLPDEMPKTVPDHAFNEIVKRLYRAVHEVYAQVARIAALDWEQSVRSQGAHSQSHRHRQRCLSI